MDIQPIINHIFPARSGDVNPLFFPNFRRFFQKMAPFPYENEEIHVRGNPPVVNARNYQP